MPSLIPKGPNLPSEMLRALQQERLVLFCGAGISVPAGLPGFGRLVELVYEALGEIREPAEQAAWKARQYDRVLWLLEDRLQKGVVRREVQRILTLAADADLSLHEAILTLARTSSGRVRLVTTNFDDAFERATPGMYNIEIDAAPKLPIPKPGTWESVVHLHGRIQSGDHGSERLVLTSADFGNAYLTDGWASRFVTELFRHFTVLFIGYSVDDPVMRYMTDALAAERARGRQLGKAYALAGISGRRRERGAIQLQWQSKSVEAIPYEASRRHVLLGNTLKEWANMHRQGLQSSVSLVRRHAAEAPFGVPDEVARRFVWALSDPSGVAAAALSKIEPPPPLRWLEIFEQEEFREAALLGSEINVSWKLVDNGYRNPQPLWTPVGREIGRWLCRHLAERDLLEWVVRRGSVLHPQMRWLVRRRLEERPALPEPHRILWEILASESFAERSVRTFSFFPYDSQLEAGLLSPVARGELLHLWEPVPTFRALSPEEKALWAELSPESHRLRDLLDWEIELAGRQAAQHLVRHQLARSPGRESILAGLAWDLTTLLVQAMDWFTLLDPGSLHDDPSRMDRPSIHDHSQNRQRRHWTLLIELVRDAYFSLDRIDRRSSGALLARWRSLPYPLFKRLLLHAATEPSSAPTDLAVDVLLESEARALWDKATQREAMRFLRQAGNRLARQNLDRIVAAIRKGPIRSANQLAEGWEEYSLREISLRLAKLRQAGVELNQADLELAQKTPLPEDHRDEFSFWLEGGLLSASQPSAEELEPLTPSQLAELLGQDRGRRGDLIYALRRLVERSPDQGSRVLRLLAENSQWPSDAWKAGLSSRQKVAKSESQDTGFYVLLALAPDRLFAEAQLVIASWLYVEAKSLPPECEPLFWPIFDRCWRAAIEQGPEIEASLEEAINHPAGILTDALIERLASREPQSGSGLPAGITPHFQYIVSGQGHPYTLARVVLISHLLFLHSIDPSWTEQWLLPRLDWDRSDEAIHLWKSYLWSPRLDADLLEAIRPHLIATLHHRDELGRAARDLERLLTLISLETRRGLPASTIQDLLRKTDDEGLVGIAEILADMLERAGEQCAVLWRERIGPWLSQYWPRRKGQQTSRVAVALALTAIKAGPAFPEAIEAVSGSLTSSASISGILFALTESPHPDQHPQGALTLLDQILPFDRPDQAFGFRSYLEGIKNRIERAWPEAVDRLEYRRLCDFLLQGAS